MVTNVTTYSESINNHHFADSFSVDNATTGLNLVINTGSLAVGSAVTVVAKQTVALTASQTNYVYVDLPGTTVATSTSAPGNTSLLYIVTTDGSGITSIVNARGAVPTSKETSW